MSLFQGCSGWYYTGDEWRGRSDQWEDEGGNRMSDYSGEVVTP